MELDRRTFLRLCGATAGTLLLPPGLAYAGAQSQVSPGQGMLSDLTKCIGCGYCQKACCEWNHLRPAEDSGAGEEPDCQLSAELWTLPELREIKEDGQRHRVFVKRQCMHCLEPACVSACPVGALSRLESGAITYDASKCIGCRYCMVACPYSVPKFEWDERLPRIRKCTFCADRQEQGMEPACSAACPTGALTFGQRDGLIAEAESRIQAHPERYVSHIYGKDELGGTSWMYLSSVPFEALGFPQFKTEPVTGLSEAVATYGTAGVAASVAVMLGGFYLLNHRRNGLEFEAPSAKEGGEDQ